MKDLGLGHALTSSDTMDQERHATSGEDKEVVEATLQNRSVLDLCPKLDKLWIFYPHLRMLNFFLVAPILAQVVSGFDTSLLNGMQSLDSWVEYFGTPTGTRLGTMTNGVTIGVLISVPFVSYLSDYLGRRWSLILGCVISIIGAILQASAHGYSQFVGSRILLGVGLCISATAAGPMLTECSYPPQRASVTAMLLASWSFGAFVSALITWGCYHGAIISSSWSWRIPSLLQGFFPLIQIGIAFFGPESPRWLISRGREEEARKFFVKYHANGDDNSLLVSYQMAEITATIEEEKVQKTTRWDKWLQKGMRLRFFIVVFVPAMLQLEGNALISYYLNIILENINITDAVEKLKINLGITVYSYFMSLVVATFADKFKRKTMFLTGLSTMLVCYVIWTILSALDQKAGFMNKSLSIGVVAFIYLYNGFNPFCANIGTPYVMELSPFSLRAKASMIYQLSGNVVGLFNNYVNPIAMEKITWKYYIVYDVWLAVLILIVIFIFPETHGKALEEVTESFDEAFATGRAAIKHRALIDEKTAVSEHVEEV